ncbi:hypothetical protein [Jannaschia sp. 2305UL9-9]|uniref:hypothetical protein n=1 Tax=Jannaschia sp. 2305UL9-9 TaxID=3121638 RepID=UPI0035299514
MGLGDMMGKAASALGSGNFDISEKMTELGIDPAMLEGLDIDAAKTFLEEKGIDFSMLDSLGIDLNEILAKLTGKEA